MRKLLVILFISISLPAFAQTAPKPRVIAKPAQPTPTPAPKKTLFGRVFGKPEPTPAPTPEPKATPKPKPKVAKPKPRATEVAPSTQPDSEAPAEKPPGDTPPTPEPAPAQPEGNTPPKTEATATKPESTPPAAEAPKIAKGVKTKPEKPAKPDLSNLDEAGKYQAIKELAAKDPAIVELRTKADSTIDEADAKRASLAYNRALFQKIRALEPSLDAYVDRLEQAVLKRLK
jgi:hypothetical protein